MKSRFCVKLDRAQTRLPWSMTGAGIALLSIWICLCFGCSGSSSHSMGRDVCVVLAEGYKVTIGRLDSWDSTAAYIRGEFIVNYSEFSRQGYVEYSLVPGGKRDSVVSSDSTGYFEVLVDAASMPLFLNYSGIRVSVDSSCIRNGNEYWIEFYIDLKYYTVE